MKKRYVYILGDYEEHGTNNVVATLDREKLPRLFETMWPNLYKGDYTREFVSDGLKELRELLAKSDVDLVNNRDGWGCHEGWGGALFYVVELQ